MVRVWFFILALSAVGCAAPEQSLTPAFYNQYQTPDIFQIQAAARPEGTPARHDSAALPS